MNRDHDMNLVVPRGWDAKSLFLHECRVRAKRRHDDADEASNDDWNCYVWPQPDEGRTMFGLRLCFILLKVKSGWWRMVCFVSTWFVVWGWIITVF